MRQDWQPLQAELDLWRKAGLTLPLWWRDDDATAVTPRLERLASLSDTLGLPVHIAVIPHHADEDLAAYTQTRSGLRPVVHGWAHQNHAPKGQKKAEFRLHRPIEAIANDAAAGLNRLTRLFGVQLSPMFVPPWNRIAPEVVASLPDLGYRALSTATPRQARCAAPGLEQVNTHLDPIDWRGTRSLIEPRRLIAQTVALLQDRRRGLADNTEPFGVLTHHLVHDEDIWTFTQDLLHRLIDGPSRPWSAVAGDAH